MATEILGFLIIVGILIVFIVRRDLWNGASSKADEVEEASVKMRLQMEHSANAIITQMDSRIHQLEGLVNAADERARMLEQQMAAVRADQERAQRRAEKEIAEMRAAQAAYYSPQEDLPMPPYRSAMRENPWAARDEYRARVAASEQSLRPVERVPFVRRSEYAQPVRQEERSARADFAETLSASMYAAEAGDGAYQRTRAGYYGNGQPAVYPQSYPRNERYPENAAYSRDEVYDAQEYGNHFAAAAYPAEPDLEETWEQYVEQPRRAAPPQETFRARRAQAIPVEMAVEETPAVLVDSKMVSRQEDFPHEEAEDKEPVFSPEQLEELARTEAEVVVSSSVADVVDLPMDSDEKKPPYGGAEDEDIHAFAETDAGDADTTISETAQEEARPGQFGEQDLLDPESAQRTLVSGANPIAAPGEKDSGTAQAMPAEAESSGTEETAPSESEEGNAADATDAESLDTQRLVLLEAPVGDEEDILADETSETLDDHYDASETENTARDIREEDIRSRSSSPTSRARELLAQGMSPKEVAQETGMGRSAVELLAQMAQGKLN